MSFIEMVELVESHIGRHLTQAEINNMRVCRLQGYSVAQIIDTAIQLYSGVDKK